MTSDTPTPTEAPALGSVAYYRAKYRCSAVEARALAHAWAAGLAARARWQATQNPQPRKEG